MTQRSSKVGHERLAEVLASAGVTVAFGVPGVHNLPLWTSFADHGIEIVGTRHEQTAAYAADGYARATGKLGVALVTTGPGAGNAVTGTGEAFTVGSPILVVATDIATTVRREGVFRGALHECKNQVGMFEPVTKMSFVAEAGDDLGAITKSAVEAALSAPCGPVYLGIPIDLLDTPEPATPEPVVLRSPSHRATATDLRGVADELNQAEDIVVWAGGGAVASGCGRRLTQLIDKLDASFVTTYAAKGLVPFDHPLVLTVPPQMPKVEGLWQDADVVVVVGSDLDAMMTRSWLMKQPKRLIAINIDEHDASKNYPADRTLVGDADTILADLLPLLDDGGRRDEVAAVVAEINESSWGSVREECPEAVGLLDALAFEVPDDTNVVLDMCVAGYWVGSFGRESQPRKVAYPVGWGTLGFGLPASIGTARAGTGPTVVVIGDGGFMYATGELATIAQEQSAITIVVVDDHAYGMLKYAQDARGLPNLGVQLVTPDFVRLAESFNIAATKIDGFGPEFAAAVRKGTESGLPNLIWVEAALLPPPTTSTRAERVSAPESKKATA